MHLLLSVNAATTKILIKIQNDYKSSELTLKNRIRSNTPHKFENHWTNLLFISFQFIVNNQYKVYKVCIGSVKTKTKTHYNNYNLITWTVQ